MERHEVGNLDARHLLSKLEKIVEVKFELHPCNENDYVVVAVKKSSNGKNLSFFINGIGNARIFRCNGAAVSRKCIENAWELVLGMMLHAAEDRDLCLERSALDMPGMMLDSNVVILERGTCIRESLEIWLDLNERHDDESCQNKYA